MAEKKEKKYVSDNAQLMAEWNWEKNDELNFDPKILTVGSEKKYGGNVVKGTNGKRRFRIETTVLRALFVILNAALLFLNMCLYIILKNVVWR